MIRRARCALHTRAPEALCDRGRIPMLAELDPLHRRLEQHCKPRQRSRFSPVVFWVLTASSRSRECDVKGGSVIRRLVIVAVAVGALALCPGLAAAAVQKPVPIGPDQSFIGLVNGAGSNGVIRMGCFGPSRPAQMGHPLAGQSIEVRPSAITAAAPAFTGKADQIDAVLRLSHRRSCPSCWGRLRTTSTPPRSRQICCCHAAGPARSRLYLSTVVRWRRRGTSRSVSSASPNGVVPVRALRLAGART